MLAGVRPDETAMLAVSLIPSTWLSKLHLYVDDEEATATQFKSFPSIPFKPNANKLTNKNLTRNIFR
jgi:hypothetical protein